MSSTAIPSIRRLASILSLALPVLVAMNASADLRMAMGAGPGGMPEVVVYSGVGAGPQSFLAFNSGFRGGVRVALGDVNGDGVSDLIAGAGADSSAVRVFDGVSGSLLRDFSAFEPAAAGGVYVAVGDVNGDGRPDLVVSNGGVSAQGHVKVFDGRTGALIDSYFAYDAAFAGGVRVAVGDVNGDGRADVVAARGPGGASLIRVFDGLTHALLREFMAFDPGFLGGVFVGAGDVNGDGLADVIASTDAGSSPQVAIYEVATLRGLGSFLPYPGFQGGVRVAVGDLTGDGLADVITGPGAGMSSQINTYSAPAFGTPSSFLAFAAGVTGGVNVATTVQADVLLRDGFE